MLQANEKRGYFMNKVKICFLLLHILILIFLCGCSGSVPTETDVPKEGIWCCEELQAELNFDPASGEYSKVTVDGEKPTFNTAYPRGVAVFAISKTIFAQIFIWL